MVYLIFIVDNEFSKPLKIREAELLVAHLAVMFSKNFWRINFSSNKYKILLWLTVGEKYKNYYSLSLNIDRLLRSEELH